MTLQETLDEIARLKGWKVGKKIGTWVRVEGMSMEMLRNHSHPIPATRDSIAALWPCGWSIAIELCPFPTPRWRARAECYCTAVCIVTKQHATELEARAALLLAVLRHEKADQ